MSTGKEELKQGIRDVETALSSMTVDSHSSCSYWRPVAVKSLEELIVLVDDLVPDDNENADMLALEKLATQNVLAGMRTYLRTIRKLAKTIEMNCDDICRDMDLALASYDKEDDGKVSPVMPEPFGD